MEGVCGILRSDAVADWAQLIAAIVALWIAVKGPIWHSDHVERENARSQLKAILGISVDAFSHLEKLNLADNADNWWELIEDPERPDYIPIEKLTHASQVLKQIPVQEFEDYLFVVPVLQFATAIQDVAHQLDGGSRSTRISDNRLAAIERSISKAKRSLLQMQGVAAIYERKTRLGGVFDVFRRSTFRS